MTRPLNRIRSRTNMNIALESVKTDDKGNHLRVWETFKHKGDDDNEGERQLILESNLHHLLPQVHKAGSFDS